MDVGVAASAAAADVPTQKEKLPMKIAKPMKAAGKATSMKTMKSSMKAKKRAKDKTVKVVASHQTSASPAKPSKAMTKAKKNNEEGKPPPKKSKTSKDSLDELKSLIAGASDDKQRAASSTMVMRRPSAAADDDDPEVRDRMKQYHFQQQLRCRTLDPDILQLWEKIKGTLRKAETAFINGVMSKDPRSSKFKADKTSPAYIEMKTKTEANYWSDESTGVPRGLAENQWGGAAKLLEAIRDGDVKETEDNGQKFYSWRQITVGKSGKVEGSQQIRKSGTIDDSNYARLYDLIGKVGWSFTYTSSWHPPSRASV